jgi:hypothetical protein
VIFLVCFALFVVIAIIGFALASLGTEAGDIDTDSHTRVVRTGSGCDVIVTNPDLSASAVIGASVRRARLFDVDPLTQSLVIRPPRRRERRRPDRAAPSLLGAVQPGGRVTWHLDAPASTVRVRVVIGQAGSRLRIHDHRVA